MYQTQEISLNPLNQVLVSYGDLAYKYDKQSIGRLNPLNQVLVSYTDLRFRVEKEHKSLNPLNQVLVSYGDIMENKIKDRVVLIP